MFTESMPEDSLPNGSAPLSETIQENFKGFTYTDDTSQLTASMNSFRLTGRIRE
jgi:hypothetical protein